MDEKDNPNRRNIGKRSTRGEGLSLYFGNLGRRVDTDLLLELVSQVGVVTNIKFIRGKDVEKDKSYAFVEFATKEDAAYVQSVLDGIQLYGEKLNVQYERKRDTPAN